jgi:hypothetical protein
MTVELQPCGTYAAYMRHIRRHDTPCRECTDANNRYKAKYRAPSARELKPCGTTAAYRRHLRHNEEPCDECKEAQYAPNRIER